MASTLKIDTVTTPDGAGNITFSRPIVGDGSNLTGISGGKVLQVVSTTKTDVATASTGWNDITGMSISITPSATSSKIFVLVHANICNVTTVTNQ